MEIQNKIRDVNITWNRLKQIWKQNKNDRDKRWKILVFDAVVKSKLIYGLETVHLTESLNKHIDSFYIRSLRNILGWKSTFVDRTKTNRDVINEVTRIVTTVSKHKDWTFTPVSKQLINKRIKYIGHLIREDHLEPTRTVTFRDELLNHRIPNKKWVGRPRQNWIFMTKKLAFDKYKSNAMEVFYG